MKPEPREMDTVKHSKHFEGRRAFDVLMEAQRYWDNMGRFRKERERNKNYNYGDQWNDIINVDGKHMTEEEYIIQRNQVPLKNNMIRRLGRNVLGERLKQNGEPICVARDRAEQSDAKALSELLKYDMGLNYMEEIFARTFEEFLISGFVTYRIWYGWRKDKLECWIDPVNPNNFFIDNNMRDFRGWDVSCLGEVHDISFGELCHVFARSPKDYERLRNIYRNAQSLHHIVDCCNQFGYSRLHNYDFLFTNNTGLCRVIEVWRKEQKPRYRCHDYNTGEVYKIDIEDYQEMVAAVNQRRLAMAASSGIPADDVPLIECEWFIDSYWYYYYLTPFGDILMEGETPYDHKEHPYVFKAYPFIDGEIHSFVADVIDQQRYVNRLITMYDWIMRASAKGVLLVPDQALGDHSPEEFAEEWSRVDGVLFYTAKPGVPAPAQVSSNSTNIGIGELLNLQLKMFEDISGVHGAMQGRAGNSGESGTLYMQQAQNAATSLLDLLLAFSHFVKDCAYKALKDIQQYYDDKKIKDITGAAGIMNVNPYKIRNTECDINIVESVSSPSMRIAANEFIMELWRSGQITLRQMLRHGDFPYGDELLQDIASQEEQIAQGNIPEGINPSLMQQAQQGVDMNAVNNMQQMIGARHQ